MATAIRQNPYSHNWATFAANTGDHELSVIFDNGDYRHLRMSKPGMLAWHWEIFTAPGYLAFVGDIGVQLIFRRTTDMLGFFNTRNYGDIYGDGSPFINPGYWEEKAGPDMQSVTRTFDVDHAVDVVRDAVNELVDCDEVRAEVGDELIASARDAANLEPNAQSFGAWLYESEHLSALASEAEVEIFHPQFLNTCFALATIANRYADYSDEKES